MNGGMDWWRGGWGTCETDAAPEARASSARRRRGLPEKGVSPDPSRGPNAAAAFAAGRALFPPPDLPASAATFRVGGDEEIGPPKLKMEPGYDPADDFASTTTASRGPDFDSDDSERSEDTGDGSCREAAVGPAASESLAPDEPGAAAQVSEWSGPGPAASGPESESMDRDGELEGGGGAGVPGLRAT